MQNNRNRLSSVLLVVSILAFLAIIAVPVWAWVQAERDIQAGKEPLWFLGVYVYILIEIVAGIIAAIVACVGSHGSARLPRFFAIFDLIMLAFIITLIVGPFCATSLPAGPLQVVGRIFIGVVYPLGLIATVIIVGLQRRAARKKAAATAEES